MRCLEEDIPFDRPAAMYAHFSLFKHGNSARIGGWIAMVVCLITVLGEEEDVRGSCRRRRAGYWGREGAGAGALV